MFWHDQKSCPVTKRLRVVLSHVSKSRDGAPNFMAIRTKSNRGSFDFAQDDTVWVIDTVWVSIWSATTGTMSGVFWYFGLMKAQMLASPITSRMTPKAAHA